MMTDEGRILPAGLPITYEFIGEDGTACTVQLETEGAAALLEFLLLADQRKGDPSYTIGQELLSWSHAAKVAVSCLAAQHYIPSIDRVHKKAIWQPLLDGFDADATELIRTLIDSFIRESITEDDVYAVLNKLNPRYSIPLTPLEHWVHALIAQRDVQYDVKPLEWIAADVAAWSNRTAERWHQRKFRTCFALREPAMQAVPSVRSTPHGGGLSHSGDAVHLQQMHDEWSIEYYVIDPSGSFHSAAEVWTVQRGSRQFQERLLTDLGIAANLATPIAKSLNTAFPVRCTLTIEQAYQFMDEEASRLEQHGMTVVLPQWWSERRAPELNLVIHSPNKVSDHAGHAAVGMGMFGLNAIVDYHWQVTIDDETFTREQFAELTALKLPLVQVRGKWQSFDLQEIQSLQKQIDKQPSGQIKLAHALQLSLGLRPGKRREFDREHDGQVVSTLSAQLLTEDKWPVSRISAENELGQFFANLTEEGLFPVLPQPLALEGTLRPYQLKGFSWLIGMRKMQMGACLADDMGLGKTIQWIAYILHLQQEEGLQGPVLLICPTSVLGNWRKELARFAPHLTVLYHYGNDRLSGKSLSIAARQYHIAVTTYATAHRDAPDLGAIDWDVLTLDEAQYIKNTSAKQTRSIRKLRANHRIALTGTPVENRLIELWSIIDFLNPDYLGSQDDFRNRFVLPIERSGKLERADILRRIIRPFIMRRLKTDKKIIDDLPDKQETKVYCTLSKEQATLYEAYVQEVIRKMDRTSGMERRGIVLAALTHLKQICNHPAHYLKDSRAVGRSGKLSRLTEMLEQIIERGERALIFTQYAKMANLLETALKRMLNTEVMLMHGGVSGKLREELITQFQENPNGPQVFVMTLKTGGFGLNLTRANHVFHYDRWWNPAVENQATDRVYRIGQRRGVQVYKFICPGTLEERIDQLIESKKQLAENIIGSGESWITELSTEELKEIFMLRREMLLEEEEDA